MRSGLAGQRQVLGVSPEVTSIPVVGPSQADWDRAETTDSEAERANDGLRVKHKE